MPFSARDEAHRVYPICPSFAAQAKALPGHHSQHCDELTAALRRAYDAGLQRAEEIARALAGIQPDPATLAFTVGAAVYAGSKQECVDIADAIAAERTRVGREGSK